MRKSKKTFREKWEATLLCLKYPFLYPRNRFTDKHYNDWDLLKKTEKLFKESYVTEMSSNGFRRKCIDWKKAAAYHILKFWHNYPLQWFHCIPDYTEWGAMDTGWKSAFGDDLLKELKRAIIEDGGRRYLHDVRIMQIKEKWGRLNIYLNRYGEKTMEVLKKYEAISWRTCINCGKPAVGYTKGWVCPYCMDCHDKLKETKKGYIEKGIKWFEFIGERDPDEINMRDLLTICSESSQEKK